MKCPPDMLMAKRNEGHPTDRASLFGKRLVVAIEVEEGRRLNETIVKELTGGDDITARRMREDFWTFKPTHTAIMATNHKPVIRGTDKGIWRRVKLVPFTVSIDEADAVKDMPARLKAEWPGILAWCVRGCLAWRARGLDAPQDVIDATAKYKGEQDLLGHFLAEHTVRIPQAKVRAGALYARYEAWAKAGNEFVISQTLFGESLVKRGFEKKRSGGAWYLGLGLIQEDADSSEDARPSRESGVI
jgi:putative DNA primase/helicase